MFTHFIKEQIQDSIDTKQAILTNASLLADIETAALKVLESYQAGHKTMLAGNGGSAADAQHIAAEFVCRFYIDRPGIPAMSLSTDPSIVTAIGNDYGYDYLYSKQVAAQGQKGDIFIGISTSGNSKNVMNALDVCKEKGIYSILLTGATGGKMADLCDLCIKVPSADTPRIQESHILIGHIICEIVESEMFGKK